MFDDVRLVRPTFDVLNSKTFEIRPKTVQPIRNHTWIGHTVSKNPATVGAHRSAAVVAPLALLVTTKLWVRLLFVSMFHAKAIMKNKLYADK